MERNRETNNTKEWDWKEDFNQKFADGLEGQWFEVIDYIATNFIPRSEIRKVVEIVRKEYSTTTKTENGVSVQFHKPEATYLTALTDLLNTLELNKEI